MSAKDNQLIGSNFHSSSQYIPDRMMDLDE